jgi:hypothetical protein
VVGRSEDDISSSAVYEAREGARQVDLDSALEQFDATEANVRRLRAIWAELRGLMPSNVAFLDGGPEGRRYRELARAYDEILAPLPAINGSRPTSSPVGLNEIGQMRFDAEELGELEVLVSTEEAIGRPGTELEEYEFLLDRARRDLVREHLTSVAKSIDGLLADRVTRIPKDSHPIDEDDWQDIAKAFAQLERLAGSAIPRSKAWSQLQRHLSWHQGIDLHDIAASDWPTVRADIERNLYSELEAVPVSAEDLGTLVASKPVGSVTTALQWRNLSADEFERLIFNLISDADGYSNPQWLMQTSAPDRGRDLSVDRVLSDALSGTTRERLIIQAKHWLSRSVTLKDLGGLAEQMAFWGNPPVDVLVIATSGRFALDAVEWIERHNVGGIRPRIEMWPESHLELLLARRPHVAAAFRLR